MDMFYFWHFIDQTNNQITEKIIDYFVLCLDFNHCFTWKAVINKMNYCYCRIRLSYKISESATAAQSLGSLCFSPPLRQQLTLTRLHPPPQAVIPSLGKGTLPAVGGGRGTKWLAAAAGWLANVSLLILPNMPSCYTFYRKWVERCCHSSGESTVISYAVTTAFEWHVKLLQLTNVEGSQFSVQRQSLLSLF